MAEQWSFDMPSKEKSRDVRHPKTVCYLESPIAGEAECRPPSVLKQDGGCRCYWLADGKFCSSEDVRLPVPEDPSGLAPALEQARSERGELLSRDVKDLVGC